MTPRYLIEPPGYRRPIREEVYGQSTCARCCVILWQLGRDNPYTEHFSLRNQPYPGADVMRAAFA